MHKQRRFRSGDERVIVRNAAFRLESSVQRLAFSAEYAKTAALYYQGQPSFEDLIERIHQYILIM